MIQSVSRIYTNVARWSFLNHLRPLLKLASFLRQLVHLARATITKFNQLVQITDTLCRIYKRWEEEKERERERKKEIVEERRWKEERSDLTFGFVTVVAYFTIIWTGEFLFKSSAAMWTVSLENRLSQRDRVRPLHNQKFTWKVLFLNIKTVVPNCGIAAH